MLSFTYTFFNFHNEEVCSLLINLLTLKITTYITLEKKCCYQFSVTFFFFCCCFFCVYVLTNLFKAFFLTHILWKQEKITLTIFSLKFLKVLYKFHGIYETLKLKMLSESGTR